MANIGCSEKVISDLVAALDGVVNPEKTARAICTAIQHSGVQEEVNDLSYGLNQLFLLYGTALVFVMHGGFAMLAAGAIRSKNAINILLQTVMDAAASAIMWYLVGYGFAYGIGNNPNGFIGDALFAMARLKSHNTGSDRGRWLDFVFQWAFCATAVTIPAGSVAERCNFNAYLCYSLFISAFLYPIVTHWVWCVEGWLGYGTYNPLLGCGMIDFAGSAVVHMVGGLSGLAGAIMLGPRMGRFDMDNKPLPLPGHSAVLVVLGTILLWFGWYGFNPASTLIIDTRDMAMVSSRSAVTTTLSGAAGAISCLAWTLFRSKTFDLFALCNGALCGFVAVTAGCHALEPWAAVICGVGAGIIFDLGSVLLLKLRIDDPLGAAPMHGFCGAWGVLFVGLLAKKEYLQEAYIRDSYPYGLFYGGGGRLLACQVIGVLAVAGWTLGFMLIFFWILDRLKLLRVPPEEELHGLDISRHYSRAYYIDQYTPGVTPFTVDPSKGPSYTTADAYGKPVSRPVQNQGALGDAIMRAEALCDGPPTRPARSSILLPPPLLSTQPPLQPQPSAMRLGGGGGGGGERQQLQVPPAPGILELPNAPIPTRQQQGGREGDGEWQQGAVFIKSTKSLPLQEEGSTAAKEATTGPAGEGEGDGTVMAFASPTDGESLAPAAPQVLATKSSKNAVVPMPRDGGSPAGGRRSRGASRVFQDADNVQQF